MYISRVSGCNFQKKTKLFFFSDDRFIFTSSIEPNEMQLIMLHFILAFTGCKSSRLGVSPNTKSNTKYKYLHQWTFKYCNITVRDLASRKSD